MFKKKGGHIGLPEYLKSMSLDEKIKRFYKREVVGNSIIFVHKDSSKFEEYKFFCTNHNNTNLVLLSPKGGGDFGNHSDLLEIALKHISLTKKQAIKDPKFFNTDFFQTAMSGTLAKNPKDNVITYFNKDQSPTPQTAKTKSKAVVANRKKTQDALLKIVKRSARKEKAIFKNKRPMPVSKAKGRRQKGKKQRPRRRPGR